MKQTVGCGEEAGYGNQGKPKIENQIE